MGIPQTARTGDRQDKEGEEEKGVVAIQTNADENKMNKSDCKDCFHCGATNLWVGDCLQLSSGKAEEVTAAMRAGTYRTPTKEQQEEKCRTKPGTNMMIAAGDRARWQARGGHVPPA